MGSRKEEFRLRNGEDESKEVIRKEIGFSLSRRPHSPVAKGDVGERLTGRRTVPGPIFIGWGEEGVGSPPV